MAFRAEFAELMNRNMYDWFFEAYESLPAIYPQIFEVKQVKGAYTKHTVGLGMGKLTEVSEGDDIPQSNPLEGWSPVHSWKSFRDSFTLTEEFMEDATEEKIGDFLQETAKTWAQGVVNTKEDYAAQIFNYGGYTSGHAVFNGSITGVIDDPSGDLCYDSKPFFALSGNDRTAKNGSTYYNGLASALSIANLKTAYNLMTNTNNYNEKGEKIALMPDVLVIPSALRFTAKEIIQNTDTANLRSSVENLLSVIEWQYLTDTDAWFIGKRQQGIKFYERKMPVIQFYQNEKNNKFVAKIHTRFGVGVDNWRYWVGSNFSTS